MEVITFPDATLAVVNFLNGSFVDRGETAVVGTLIPNPLPERLVVVRRIAGVRQGLVVDLPQLSVEVWAPDESDAHDLAQLVRALIYSMTGITFEGVVVYRVTEVAGPALFRDGETDRPRFVASYQVGVRGRAV